MSKWKLRIYTNPEELHEKAEAYLQDCAQKTRKNIEAGEKMPIVAPNLAGLARYLGVTRMTLSNYINKPEYANIKDVLLYYKAGEENVWIQLIANGNKVAPFYVSNHYSEYYLNKQIVEHQTSETLHAELSDKTVPELLELAKKEGINIDKS